MKKIKLIFTRDFDQFIQEILRNVLVFDCPKIWGRGLSDQIVRFTGRTFEWYRYEKDMSELRDYLIHKPLTDKIFLRNNHQKFLRMILILRRLIVKDPNKVNNQYQHLVKIKNIFTKMYPFYPLGIFIPGPWREEFLKIHGKQGKKILKILYHSRKNSEGILKLVGNYLRKWFEPKLEKSGFPKEYVRLLTIKEIENLVKNNKLPQKQVLNKRAKGYVYFKEKIILESNFQEFIKKYNLIIADDQLINNNTKIIKGKVAFSGGVIKGEAQLIFNSFEVENFKTGKILVTPMTSPEYFLAIKKAKAIITDEGGITCHAAIVSRELKIPCVIGTKFATQIFKDGDRVEVDAGGGIVKKIN